MNIYLDESYNLKDRSKLQFISINGFQTTAVKKVWKQWKNARRRFVSKARIHATDRRFEPLRIKALNIVYSAPSTVFLSAFQNIKTIPTGRQSPYYKKDKLHFEKVYEDLLKSLFSELNLQEYRKVTITIDSRKHKGGFLGKKQFQENILSYLKQYYPNAFFRFEIVPSSSNILIEVADFISNTCYKHYIGEKVELLKELNSKIIKIKNPLK